MWGIKMDAPLTIRQADNAASACFWWLGAFLKRNRTSAYPHVSLSKILMASFTWASRWLAVNQPSLLISGWKNIWASLCKSGWIWKWKELKAMHHLSSHRGPQICCEKVRNHKCESLSLWSWNYILAWTASIYLALVVFVNTDWLSGFPV